jgi:hypothetical protein
LFLLPKYSLKVLASCTTSVYVNLSKNSFFTPDFSKAGAKVRLFSEPPKLFRRNFIILKKISFTLDKNQARKTATPYYITRTHKRQFSCPLPSPCLSPTFALPLPFLCPSFALATKIQRPPKLISDKKNVVDRKMRNFAPYK